MITAKSLHDKLSLALTVVLVACAVTATVVVVRRGQPRVGGGSIGMQFDPQPDWKSFMTGGHWIGPSTARAVLIEFSDFQCPWCKRFDDRLQETRRKYPKDFAILYRHWPLSSMHRSAKPAAIAAECAARQGHFEEMHATLFDKSDSLATGHWAEWARLSSVPDIPKFQACLGDTAVAREVERDSAAAVRVGAHGTPVSLLGGRKIRGSIPQAALDSLVSGVIAHAGQR